MAMPRSAPAKSTKIYTVLLVDDEAVVTETMKEFLERRCPNVEVRVTSRADQALDIVRKASFDAVIADHSLPGGNGVDLLAEVSKLHPATRRVLLTGTVSPEFATRAVEAQLHGYIQKPYSRDRVVDLVQQLLASRATDLPTVTMNDILLAMGRARTSGWRPARADPAGVAGPGAAQ